MKSQCRGFRADFVRIINIAQAHDWNARVGDFLVTPENVSRGTMVVSQEAFAALFEPADEEATRALAPTEGERLATAESDLDRRRREGVA